MAARKDRGLVLREQSREASRRRCRWAEEGRMGRSWLGEQGQGRKWRSLVMDRQFGVRGAQVWRAGSILLGTEGTLEAEAEAVRRREWQDQSWDRCAGVRLQTTG